jgi:hypothetical protein
MVFDIKKSEIYVKRETANAMTGSWVHHREICSSNILQVQYRDLSGPTHRTGHDKEDGHESHAGMRYKNALGTDEFKMLDDIQKDFARKSPTNHSPSWTCRTGKTTVMAAVMTAAMAAESAVKCLAPTHKAKNNLKLRVPRKPKPRRFIHSTSAKLRNYLYVVHYRRGSMVDVELLDSP